MKNKFTSEMLAALAALSLAASAAAQTPASPLQYPGNGGFIAGRGPAHALVLATHGRCEYSYNGGEYRAVTPGMVLFQGASIRTGTYASADLSLERIGTVLRLRPDSAVTLETFSRMLDRGRPEMLTVINLKAGRMFALMRYEPTGSRIEIRNSAGLTPLSGGPGNYIITADGSQVADKGGETPAQGTGITALAADQGFSAKDIQMLPEDAASDALVADLTEKERVAGTLTPVSQILPRNWISFGGGQPLR